MKKRTLALIMAVVLMLSVAIPGTLAVSQDSDSTTATLTVDEPVVTEVPETTEAPETTEVPETTETPAPETTEVPEATETPAPEVTEVPETTETPAPETTEVPETTETPAPEATETPAADLVSVNREVIFDPAGVTLYADIGSADCIFVDLPDDFTCTVRYEFVDEAGALWYMLNTDEWTDYPECAAYPFITEESVAFTDEMIPTTLAEPVDTKPKGGNTVKQPFFSGTGGSDNFRIPALITLSDGTIVAAADARWDTTSDGYGLDTIVSYSRDNGATWNYSFVNYFGDSAGRNPNASAFIDPVLVQGADGAVYLFADLYPGGGHAISSIKSGTGFVAVDGVNYLALYSSSSASSSSTPAYYVANTLENGYYTVYDPNTKKPSDYVLDAEYNIYTVADNAYTPVTGTQLNSSTTIKANVFYTGEANPSGLYVLGTEYIVMRKGSVNADGSIAWGDLRLLNVKNDEEFFYGFGPGGGITTSTGRIIVPLYTYANYSDGKTSVIYSDDNGATWTRSADVNVQTSEASISEVRIGDTNYLYMFTRHGGYFVSSDNGTTWSTQQSVSGISYTTTCELSTLTYSKYIDGCPAILLSAPTSNRTNGKIFVGLVQPDGSINWKYMYSVNSGTFQYSDMVELSDGSIGILYENGNASITYATVGIASIAPNAQISAPGTTVTDETTGVSATAVGLTGITVEVKTLAKRADGVVSEVYTVTLNGGDYTGPATLKIPCNVLFNSCGKFWGTVGENRFEVVKSDGYFVCEVPHFSDVTIYGATKTETVTLKVGKTSDAYEVTGAEVGDSTTVENVSYKVATKTTEETKTLGVKLTSTDTPAGSYVISNGDGHYLVCTNGTLSDTTDITKATEWTVTKNGNSYTLQSGDYYLRHANNSLTAGTNNSNNTWSYDGNGFYYRSNNTTRYLRYNNGWGIGRNADANTRGNAYTVTTRYLRYNNGWTIGTTNSNRGAAYTVTTTPGSSSTTVTFTGLHVGTQTVTVGDTDFTVTVTPASKTLTIAPGGSQTVPEAGAVTAVQLAAVTDVTASYNAGDGSITFTAGETEESYGPFLLGDTNYTIMVGNYVDADGSPFIASGNKESDNGPAVTQVLTKLTLSVGLSYPIGLKDGFPNGGTWSIADTDIATVNESGEVTGVKAGETTLTYTCDRQSYTIPVVILNNGGTGKICDMYFTTTMVHTTVYYSWNCSGDKDEFVQATPGEGIYVGYPAGQAYCINVFMKPDDGYALTYMAAAGSAGTYLTLQDKDSPTDDNKHITGGQFYNNGNGDNEVKDSENFGSEKVIKDVSAALLLGCDAGAGSYRGASNKGTAFSVWQFKSEKLPTVEKSILGYKRAGAPKGYDAENGTLSISGYPDYYKYNEGNVKLEFGDTVLYQFTVTKYSTMTSNGENNITYENASLDDLLIDFNQGDVGSALNGSDMNITEAGDTKQKVYYATYTIEADDLEKYSGGTFTNRVTLTYDYKSAYSKGKYGGSVEGHVTCQINGMVTYQWADDLPEEITKKPLPEDQAPKYGAQVTVAPDCSTVLDPVTTDAGVYTFQYWESDKELKTGDNRQYQTGETFTMPTGESVVFTGVWKFEPYVKINYVAVGPTGATNFGSVSLESEKILETTGKAQGSTATANANFRFVGWYDNEDCTGEALSAVAEYVPSKPETGKWVEDTFYAKFEYDTTSLTITKAAADGTTFDAGETFVFTVTGEGLPTEGLKVVIQGAGSKTINGLKVGSTYTVTEDMTWSWRYTPTYSTSNTITLDAVASKNVVTVTNERTNDKWLDGSTAAVNEWKDGKLQRTDSNANN